MTGGSMLHAMTQLRSTVFALYLFAVAVGFVNPVLGQEAADGPTVSSTTPAPPTKLAPPVEILFTARLLGYARVPDKQDGSLSALQGCPPVKKDDKTADSGFSTDASALLGGIRKSANTVLV